MGYLLKEALKTLCGVNQWSYAVFWKIGCQNPNLLIWEECYYNPVTYPYLPHSGIENPDFAFDEWEACRGSAKGLSSQFIVQAGNKVQQLVNKMMMDNQVNVLGEGLIGRAAFTGRYQWILSHNYTRESHPLEVINELSQQVSAGMQTVAVIPVLPHGVFQFGSLEAVMENMGFVNDVRTLILQLGCVPGALFSETYATQEHAYKIGTYFGHMESTSKDISEKSKITDLNHLTSYFNDNCNQQENSQISRVVGQTSNDLFGPTLQQLQSSEKSASHGQAKLVPVLESKDDFRSQLGKGVAGAEIIPSNWKDWEVPLYTSGYGMNQQHSMGALAKNTCSLSFQDGQMFVNATAGNHVGNKLSESDNLDGGILSDSHKGSASGLCNVAQHKKEIYNSSFAYNLNTSHLIPDSYDHKNRYMDEKYVQLHVDEGKEKVEDDIIHASSLSYPSSAENISFSGNIPGYVDTKKHEYAYCSVGPDDSQFEDADLFDMLGLNFENKPFNECFLNNKGPVTNSTSINLNRNKYVSANIQNACSELQLDDEGNSESGIFSGSGTYHLLDAVVSKVQSAKKQSSDDNVSCRTTLTKLSSSSAVTTSASTGRANASKLFGLSKSLTEAEPLGSCSFKSGSCKEDLGKYSQTTSFYGSLISSKVEKDYDMKISMSSSTAYSKRADENSKPNRKRLKPGENPRPRPKDRQMIQDRVKELREIVPNSAKCSIDALLERTIKHMIFLQNVSKHADKLKHAGESKIMGEGGGLLLKDNFEGGATWAYEIGSQSMVCPIIVEDLNPPRQMLVQILCEERGLFMEIADIVRGLGLTILKGVMETQKDKIWARFAVEANRDVTRMEIFVSLVGLLEQTIKSTSVPVMTT